jgi:hypothetical protein
MIFSLLLLNIAKQSLHGRQQWGIYTLHRCKNFRLKVATHLQCTSVAQLQLQYYNKLLATNTARHALQVVWSA